MPTQAVTFVNALTNETLVFSADSGDIIVPANTSVQTTWNTNDTITVLIPGDAPNTIISGLSISRVATVSATYYSGSYHAAVMEPPDYEQEQRDANKSAAMRGAIEGLTVGATFMLFFWVRRAWTVGDRMSID